MKPVANRVLDIDGAPRKLTRAESVRAWQASAKDDITNYGANPFRVGDEVEFRRDAHGWRIGRVVLARGRFEHYRVLIEFDSPNARKYDKVRLWQKAFTDIRIYEARRVRALKID